MLSVLSEEQIVEVYGKLPYLRLNDSTQIEINKDWLRENLTCVYIPQLKGKPSYGGKASGKVYCNKKIQPQLVRAFNEIEEQGLLRDVVFWGGCYNPRMVRGFIDKISRHSYGIAFDLNPLHNRLSHPPAQSHEPGTVLRLVPIFERHGFAWGGNFRRTDAMHFEATGEQDKESDSHG